MAETLDEKESLSPDLLQGYEKLRYVGKGAFGVAILYRKICDDTLVVIKEVNMIELTAPERQMALNEVRVLKILNHPNIISYYRSFEKDGMLFIEMEYADGGTLAKFLSDQTEPMRELDILYIFQQIVEAIKYIHSFNILHRDLKTANIFLTKEKIVKVGDFGISKVITTLAQANSVLGTPYYISPEMCEGKEYNQKSDIWSLGCILYEMTCLQKTFDGTNLPALVNKIIKGQFEPIPEDYTINFRELIHELLEKDPTLRPTASEILDCRIQKILNKVRLEKGNKRFAQESSGTLQNSFKKKGKLTRSVFYELVCYESITSLFPIPLPPRFKVEQIAISASHFIALTTEFLVYTWGEGRKGQLGHGDTTPWKGTPQLVEALKDKNIKMVAAGDGFSVFASECGMLMSCGDGSFGCLGHGNWKNVFRPKLLENLLNVDIVTISCGVHHVSALSRDGTIYSWGRGKDGRLGLGHEENSCSPSIVSIPNEMVLRNVKSGGDVTMAITSGGMLLACGSNEYNKLGLSRRSIFSLRLQVIQKSLILRKVPITEKISDVSLGPNHTTVLTERGHVITMGRNTEGQLGRGDTKTSPRPLFVSSLSDKITTMVNSGATFTIIATHENEIYFWGTRYKKDILRKDQVSRTWAFNKYESISPISAMLRVPFPNDEQEVILVPKGILGLYASKLQIDKGETVSLAGIYSAQSSIFVLVDTSVPLKIKRTSKKETVPADYEIKE